MALCRALCCGSAWGLHKACPAAHARRHRFCVQAPVARRPEQHADGYGERSIARRGKIFDGKEFFESGFSGVPGTAKFFRASLFLRSSFAKFPRFDVMAGNWATMFRLRGFPDPSRIRSKTASYRLSRNLLPDYRECLLMANLRKISVPEQNVSTVVLPTCTRVSGHFGKVATVGCPLSQTPFSAGPASTVDLQTNNLSEKIGPVFFCFVVFWPPVFPRT